MVYVDLNPIRAGMSSTLEESTFTSIAQRIGEFSNKTVNSQTAQQQQQQQQQQQHVSPPITLADFIGSSQSRPGIPYTLHDYFELADWSGRAIRDVPRGFSLVRSQFTLTKRVILLKSNPKSYKS